jgi:hypothetical protein
VIVRKIDGRIYLKLIVEAPRKPNRKEVFFSALINRLGNASAYRSRKRSGVPLPGDRERSNLQR